MPKYRVKIESKTINVFEVEADDRFKAEELAWEGHGTIVDSYPAPLLDEVHSSERI